MTSFKSLAAFGGRFLPQEKGGRPLKLASGPRLAPEVFNQESPALVVPPAAIDLQVAAREALPLKAALAHQCNRGGIAGLDIGFHPVQLELAERMVSTSRIPSDIKPCRAWGRKA